MNVWWCVGGGIELRQKGAIDSKDLRKITR